MLMRPSQDEDLAKLHGELVRCRLALEAARQTMIEALGDWMCGSGTAPPGAREVEALALLSAARDRAEEAYEAYSRGLMAQMPPPARSQSSRAGRRPSH